MLLFIPKALLEMIPAAQTSLGCWLVCDEMFEFRRKPAKATTEWRSSAAQVHDSMISNPARSCWENLLSAGNYMVFAANLVVFFLQVFS